MNTQKEGPLDNPTSDQAPIQMISVQQVLQIRTQNKLYAIDLSFVECVLPLMELHQTSEKAPYSIGFIDYRGKNLTVIDLGSWLGFKAKQTYNLDSPIIICGNGQAQVALVVSEVMQVEMIKPEAIQTQDLFKEVNAPYKASLNLSSGEVLLLDMQSFFDIPTQT